MGRFGLMRSIEL